MAKDDLAFVHDSIESVDEDELAYRHDQPELNEVMVGDGPATADINKLLHEYNSYEDDSDIEDATVAASRSIKLVKIEKDDHQKSGHMAGDVPEQNTADDDQEQDDEDDEEDGEELESIDDLNHPDDEYESDESSSPRPRPHLHFSQHFNSSSNDDIEPTVQGRLDQDTPKSVNQLVARHNRMECKQPSVFLICTTIFFDYYYIFLLIICFSISL